MFKRLQRLLRGKIKYLVIVLAAVIVFTTTYVLILPAITIETSDIGEGTGLVLTSDPAKISEDASEETMPAVVFDAELRKDGKSVTVEGTTELEAEAPKDEHLDAEEQEPLLRVTAEAKEGTFPAGTTMKVTEVTDNEKIAEAIEGAVSNPVSQFQAVDITFYTKDGKEIEPQFPIQVTITSNAIKAAKKEETIEPVIVHIPDKGEAKVLNSLGKDQLDGVPAEDAIVFETDQFSIYAVVETTIEKTILTSDGYNYLIKVSYGPETGISEDAWLDTWEIEYPEYEYDEDYEYYKVETERLLGVESDDISYARFFDITIYDEYGEPMQPAEGTTVRVKIQLDDREDGIQPMVVHFGEEAEVLDSEVDGQTISFETNGFSVYEIVETDHEPVSIDSVKTLEELAQNYENMEYFLSYGNHMYFTNRLNDKGAFFEDSNMGGASLWYFEEASGQNTYYIYTYVNDEKLYMYNQSGNEMSLDASSKTAFELSQPVGVEGKFYFKKAGANQWLQHSGSGSGIRLYTDNNNATNSRIVITNAALPDDPYGLDGKTYGIAYHNESATSAAVTAESQIVSNQQRLQADDLLMQPDVRDNDGILLVAKDSDIQEWTFHSVGEDKYNISTMVDGVRKYLTIDGANVTLAETADPILSLITAAPGTGSNSGKWHFTVNGYSLNLPNGSANGFNAVSGNGVTTWMNLVQKTDFDESIFTLYSAKKVSVSDTVNVHNEQQVVLYTRVWNDTAKKYEFYVVDHDGSLIPCYDTGDNIEWIGSSRNSALWTFTEGTNTDGTPSYYYWLENVTYGRTFITPQVTSDQVIYTSPTSAGTQDFNASVNLNGRRYGEDFTTIICWDEDQYSYSGLKVENGHVVPCALADAEDFYFAIINPTQLNPEGEPQLSTVETIDNNEYGIVMTMIDYNNPKQNSSGASAQSGNSGRDSGQTAVLGYNTDKAGLLETQLQDDGYPMTNAANTGKESTSLYTLYSQNDVNHDTILQPVNHLFIQSTYNESGYFEYDSTQNFAKLEEDGNFTVYNQLAAVGNYPGSQRRTGEHGQFMPYDTITEGNYCEHTNQTDVLAQELSDSDPRKGEKLYNLGNQNDLDYYFGMEMEATFTQTADGLDAWGHDIIFEFSGDDDFWFYVDGELVLDLGGVHSAMTGSINFRTGKVTSSRGNSTLYAIFRQNYLTRNPDLTEQQLNEILLGENGIFEAKTVDGEQVYVFKDYSPHSMKMFYMERGAGASNLHMRFNLASVKPGNVELSKKLSGTDSASNDLIQYPYQIWYTDQSDGESQFHLLDNPSLVTYKDSSRTVTYAASFTPAGGEVAYDHVFFLKAGETAVIDLPDGVVDYYIVECGINPDVYDHVYVNGNEITGDNVKTTDNIVNGTARRDYQTTEASPYDRARVEFNNHVPEGVMGTLSITKKLYDTDGETLLTYPENKTPFSFRLYLGNEDADPDQLPLADLYSYYVKDLNGNYCRWDAIQKQFISLGVSSYEALLNLFESQQWTEAMKETVIFKTSMNGSISKVPAGYTVEVRDLIAGSQWKVEERNWEIPKGYTRRYTDGYTRTDIEPEDQQSTPYSGTMAKNENPKIDIRNQKGWGLTVEKVWTDKDFMLSHDTLFFAVYLDMNTPEIADDALLFVQQMTTDETELYWYFDDLYYEGTAYDFSNFYIREVTLSGEYVIDQDDGYVWKSITTQIIHDDEEDEDVAIKETEPLDPDQVHPVVEGGKITVSGESVYHVEGDADYTVHYTIGAQTAQNNNIRTDTVTNSRPGIELFKQDWSGAALAGTTFTLKDSTEHDVAAESYTSNSAGLITIAYLNEGTYTLKETVTPTGYASLPSPIVITVGSNDTLTFTLENGSSTDTVTVDSDGNVTGESDFFSVQSGSEGMTATVIIKNRKAELEVKKVDEEGDGLSGAHFALYYQVKDNQGNLIKDNQPISGFEDIVSAEDGILSGIDLETLTPGKTYYLVETQAADGYKKLPEDLCFTIGLDGTVTINSEGHDGWLISTTTDGGVLSYLIEVPNEPFQITIQKEDDSGHALPGATFNLKTLDFTWVNVDVGQYGITGGTADGVIDMDDTASVTLSGLPDGRYQLTETSAPDGYIILSNTIYFKIADGQAELTDASGYIATYSNATLDKSTMTITIMNTPGAALPASGGIGTHWFYWSGAVLTLSAAIALLWRRQKRRRKRPMARGKP